MLLVLTETLELGWGWGAECEEQTYKKLSAPSGTNDFQNVLLNKQIAQQSGS